MSGPTTASARARTSTLPARPVTVSRFDVLATRDGEVDGIPVLDVDVEVTVSSGTYVRALARDLGAALGVGWPPHRAAPHPGRARSPSTRPTDLEPPSASCSTARAPRQMPVTPLADAARAQFAVRELTAEETTAVGLRPAVDSAQPGRTEPVAAFAPDGRLVAMLDESGHKAKAHVVFAPAGS